MSPEIVKPSAVAEQKVPALVIPPVAVGDRVLYSASMTQLPGQLMALTTDPRLAFVTKVHAGRPGKVNLVYFQVEKGEDPVLFAEDVGYYPDATWAGYWSPLPA